jgi:hypothetical protein
VPGSSFYIYGRVLDEAVAGRAWEQLGEATPLRLACGYACTVVAVDRTVWVLDETGKYRRHVCERQPGNVNG